MVEYAKRSIPILTIIEFRKLWDKCVTLEEKDIVRDKFFGLDYGEEPLEIGWDKVVLGEEYYPLFPKVCRDVKSNLAGKLPENELVRFRMCGYSVRELGEIFKISPQTMLKALQQLGLNRNQRILKREYYFLGEVEI